MSTLTLVAFVPPLGLDSFAAAAGAAGRLPPRVRWRVSLLFCVRGRDAA
jgi:hypothetical protein